MVRYNPELTGCQHVLFTTVARLVKAAALTSSRAAAYSRRFQRVSSFRGVSREKSGKWQVQPCGLSLSLSKPFRLNPWAHAPCVSASLEGHQPSAGKSEPETRTPRSETRNPKPDTRNPKPKTRNPKPETRHPKPETRNPKPETRNPKPGARCRSL